MAGEITINQMADLILTTMDKIPGAKNTNRWTDLTGDIPYYIVVPRLFKQEKMDEANGYEFTRFAQIDDNDSTRAVGLHDTNDVVIKDTMTKYTIPKRNWKCSTGWEMHELMANQGDVQFVDLIKTRLYAMDVSHARKTEEWFWTPMAADDGLTPYSIRNWVVHSTGAAGFNGTAPAGWSELGATAAGSRNRNYTFTYSDGTALTDLLDAWWLAYLKCDFRSPVPHADYSSGPARFEFYTNFATMVKLRKLAESRNESMGYDLGIKRDGGGITFGGASIVPVPYMDQIPSDVTLNPIIGLDWSKIKFVFQTGFYQRQYGPQPAANQRNSIILIRDTTGNLDCFSRRSQMIGVEV